MESVKTRVYKTTEHIHHNNGHSVQDGHHPKSLKSESKIIRSDYQLLSDHSQRWMDSVQEMQTKWEILANTIGKFGDGLYVDNSRINELSRGFHGLQNLMFPIIKTTKIGIHDNAENISQHSVSKLKKQNHQMENNRVRADNATHKLDKYRSKSKTNPTTLKKKEANAEKATILYDQSYRQYQHDVRDLEYKSVDNLHFSRQLLFDLQDFFNNGYSLVHSLRQSMDQKPVQEKLHSRFGLLDQALPPTYEKYHSSYIPKDHDYPVPHGSIIFDDEDKKEWENESNGEEIKETTTEITTTTYQVPSKESNLGTTYDKQSIVMVNQDTTAAANIKKEEDDAIASSSNSFKRLSVSETNSPLPQKSTYVSATTTDAGDLSTSTLDSNITTTTTTTTAVEKKVLIPTIIKEETITDSGDFNKSTKNATIISPTIVREYVYQGESSEIPSDSNFVTLNKQE